MFKKSLRLIALTHFGRTLFARALFALPLFAASAAVSAQSTAPYPTKSIKLVVPYPAGGPADMLARSVAEKLAVRLGQPVVIDNRGAPAAMWEASSWPTRLPMVTR